MNDQEAIASIRRTLEGGAPIVMEPPVAREVLVTLLRVIDERTPYAVALAAIARDAKDALIDNNWDRIAVRHLVSRIDAALAANPNNGGPSMEPCTPASGRSVGVASDGISTLNGPVGGVRLERRLEVAEAELARVRANFAHVFDTLMGIHNLLDPAPVEANGKTMVFVNPHAAEALHELSKRIRAIPEKLDTLRVQGEGLTLPGISIDELVAREEAIPERAAALQAARVDLAQQLSPRLTNAIVERCIATIKALIPEKCSTPASLQCVSAWEVAIEKLEALRCTEGGLRFRHCDPCATDLKCAAQGMCDRQIDPAKRESATGPSP